MEARRVARRKRGERVREGRAGGRADAPSYGVRRGREEPQVPGVDVHEDGEAFAREFLRTTFLWSCFWLNEREVARRPWLHQKSYVKIDQLLREEVPAHFAHRKLESEYAAYVAA